MGEKTIQKGTDLVKILVDNGKGSEAILQKLCELFPVILITYNTDDQKFTFLNDKIKTLLGYSDSDLIDFKNDFFQIIYAEDKQKVQEIILNGNELEENKSFVFTCNLMSKSGKKELFHFEGSVVDTNTNSKPLNILFTAKQVNTEVECNEHLENSKALMYEKLKKRTYLLIWP